MTTTQEITAPADIRTLVESIDLPDGVTVHFSGSNITFAHPATSKTANHALHVARRRVVNSLISNTAGRRFSGPKRAQRVYLGESMMHPDGLTLRLSVSETDEEAEAHRLGLGGIFARRGVKVAS